MTITPAYAITYEGDNATVTSTNTARAATVHRYDVIVDLASQANRAQESLLARIGDMRRDLARDASMVNTGHAVNELGIIQGMASSVDTAAARYMALRTAVESLIEAMGTAK